MWPENMVTLLQNVAPENLHNFEKGLWIGSKTNDGNRRFMPIALPWLEHFLGAPLTHNTHASKQTQCNCIHQLGPK